MVDHSPIYVVLSASFGAKDLLILAPCHFQEILRAKRRAQDDVELYPYKYSIIMLC
ncbi:hypothetical protein Lsha_1740 [Legionella shakespearei DSM 23087]|uniref:Uncharacterized protein n=1 Tax=Legionella shakespearei DSM 23087 TaxID=1122169 RepID=A0A0W0YTY2_9GAMM|nr:hypothetical protein Lsha_1740 [Legionella shakespearei DSM 23087]